MARTKQTAKRGSDSRVHTSYSAQQEVNARAAFSAFHKKDQCQVTSQHVMASSSGVGGWVRDWNIIASNAFRDTDAAKVLGRDMTDAVIASSIEFVPYCKRHDGVERLHAELTHALPSHQISQEAATKVSQTLSKKLLPYDGAAARKALEDELMVLIESRKLAS
jgi:hypothetical protein